MINEAKNQWRRGALVHLMYHACPPTQSEACGWEGGVLSGLSNDQWDELVSDGTPLNNVWKSRLNSIVPYLEDLKNNGVAVLWQPLHEMNQQKFWWGGRPGPNGTRKLFQITHDYLVKSRGLTNLIWIWDIQDFAGFPQDLSGGWKGYNPGDSYWDIAALDVYGTDRRGYANDKYNAMVNVAEGKPIAIGECDRLPTAEELTAQLGWVFFMAWAELVKTKNSPQEIARLYDSRKTLALSELPGWRRVSR
jgi:mannan endo-1,4-beta-mannosidase